MRDGFTAVETLVVLVLSAMVCAIAVHRFSLVRDSTQVHAAAHEIVAALAGAREGAMAAHRRAAVLVSPQSGNITVAVGHDTLSRRSLRAGFGVTLRASRDSLAYDERGLGVGASNTSIIVERGSVRETVFVSRLGRVRH